MEICSKNPVFSFSVYRSTKITVLIALFLKIVNSEKFEDYMQWKQIDFDFRHDVTEISSDFVFPEKNYSLPVDDFIPYNNVPQGINYYKGKLFVTTPRRRPGVPVTLSYIDLSQSHFDPSPRLKPYPNLEINSISTGSLANKLVSVYRTRTDECHRMWFVDTGMLEYPNNRTQLKRPQIWIIDMENNQVLRKHQVPENIVLEGRGLTSITVDTNSQSCDDAFAYIPDIAHYAVHVYSYKKDKMWRFRHNYFGYDPVYGDFNIGGQKFQWSDGIFSITLGDREENGYRVAYFHPMASISEFYVSTRVLQNETNAARAYHGNDFKVLGNRGERRQSTIHMFDPRTKVIFFAEVAKDGIGCWNTKSLLSPQNIDEIHQDARKMIYPSDINIDMEGTIWMMTNSMPVFIYSSLDTKQYNFHVWKQSGAAAIQGTKCAYQ